MRVGPRRQRPEPRQVEVASANSARKATKNRVLTTRGITGITLRRRSQPLFRQHRPVADISYPVDHMTQRPLPDIEIFIVDSLDRVPRGHSRRGNLDSRLICKQAIRTFIGQKVS